MRKNARDQDKRSEACGNFNFETNTKMSDKNYKM